MRDTLLAGGYRAAKGLGSRWRARGERFAAAKRGLRFHRCVDLESAASAQDAPSVARRDCGDVANNAWSNQQGWQRQVQRQGSDRVYNERLRRWPATRAFRIAGANRRRIYGA